MKCNKCGKEYNSQFKFCPNCGNSSVVRKNPIKKLLITCLVLFVSVIIEFIVLCILPDTSTSIDNSNTKTGTINTISNSTQSIEKDESSSIPPLTSSVLRDETSSNVTQISEAAASSTSENNVQAKNEDELLMILQIHINYQVSDYLYLDMDHDGNKEIIAAQTDLSDRSVRLWFCSCDGAKISEIKTDTKFYDFSAITNTNSNYFTAIEVPNETHIAYNVHWIETIQNKVLSDQSFSIFALKNGTVETLCEDIVGNVYYDSIQDEIQVSILDSELWDVVSKPYLYYDGQYHEYPAKQITEEEFLKFDNAVQVRYEDNTFLGYENEWKYFLLDNDILYIQVKIPKDAPVTEEYRDIKYGYTAYRIRDNSIAEIIGSYKGEVEEYSTNLDKPNSLWSKIKNLFN